jgi:hypothetical protein
MEGDLAVYDPARGDRKVFKVDRVFDGSATQTGIYEDTQPLIRSVLDGKQCPLLYTTYHIKTFIRALLKYSLIENKLLPCP